MGLYPRGGVDPQVGAPALIEDNKLKLLNRLNHIEGQVCGIAGTVEEGRYCIDL
jgi:hypothetical protein